MERSAIYFVFHASSDLWRNVQANVAIAYYIVKSTTELMSPLAFI
jgi:hypothetical protein